jgi:hypothetical protein
MRDRLDKRDITNLITVYAKAAPPPPSPLPTA